MSGPLSMDRQDRHFAVAVTVLATMVCAEARNGHLDQWNNWIADRTGSEAERCLVTAGSPRIL
ncbi:hypothetical protein ABID25_006538 [Mesorhizobium abyssinicae]